MSNLRGHRLLKYMIGTKGRTQVGANIIVTCRCGEWAVYLDSGNADWFERQHKECKCDY